MICGSWIFHQINSMQAHISVCMGKWLETGKNYSETWWNAILYWMWYSNRSRKNIRSCRGKFYLVFVIRYICGGGQAKRAVTTALTMTTATIIMDKLVIPILILMLTLPYANQSLKFGSLVCAYRPLIQISLMFFVALQIVVFCLVFVVWMRQINSIDLKIGRNNWQNATRQSIRSIKHRHAKYTCTHRALIGWKIKFSIPFFGNILRHGCRCCCCCVFFSLDVSFLSCQGTQVYASHSLFIVMLMKCAHNKCIFVNTRKSVFD